MLSYYAALACANLQRKESALGFLDGAADSLGGEGPAFLKAALLREMNRPQEALDAIQAVRAQNPANVDAVIVQAGLLEALGRVDRAEEALRSLLPAERRRIGVELAGLFLRNGRVEDAKRIAEEALA